MALGNSNIPYTPFQETSFGYGSTELASNYSSITGFQNSTDIVKIVIQHLAGNWDDTGHISTPSSGTAVSVYDPTTKTFTVRGQRSDVDVVLSQLTFSDLLHCWFINFMYGTKSCNFSFDMSNIFLHTF